MSVDTISSFSQESNQAKITALEANTTASTSRSTGATGRRLVGMLGSDSTARSDAMVGELRAYRWSVAVADYLAPGSSGPGNANSRGVSPPQRLAEKGEHDAPVSRLHRN